MTYVIGLPRHPKYNIIHIMFQTALGRRFFVYLYHQPHIFHFASVLLAGSDDINSCGVYTAMAEDIGKLCYILFDAVKSAGEKVAEVVRKHLFG